MKITLNDVGLIGAFVTGLGIVQLLGYLQKLNPVEYSQGVFIVLSLIVLLLVAIGFVNWSGLYFKASGYSRKHITLIGFMPTIILGSLVLIFYIMGLSL